MMKIKNLSLFAAFMTLSSFQARAEILFSEFFESVEWQALANPSDRESINVSALVRGSTGNPSGWLIASGNAFNDNFFISDGKFKIGPDFVRLVHTTSFGLKNYSCMYVPLNGVSAGDKIQLSFEYEIDAANGTLHYGLWNGEPVFPGATMDLGSHPQGSFDLTSSLHGRVETELTVAAGASPVYLVFYKAGWGSAVHIDQIIASKGESETTTIILEEDFETHADWTTLGGGSLPAADTVYKVPNSVAGVRSDTFFNGWNFINAGVGADWTGDLALVNNTSVDASYNPDNSGSVTLMLKNWTMVYKEIDLTNVSRNQVALTFDYFFSSVVNTDGSADLKYGIFDSAPSNDNRNDWEISGTEYSITPAAAQAKGSADMSGFDTSGMSGSIYIGFFKENYNGAVGIDNVVLTTREAGTNYAPVAYAGQVGFNYRDATFWLHGSDVNGDGLTYIVVDAPTNGTFSINGCEVTYTANGNSHDRMTFKVSDGELESETVEIELLSVLNIPFWDHTLSIDERLDDIMGRLTLVEKATLCEFDRDGIPRFGIEAVREGVACHGFIDRPHHTTVFPCGIGMAASWNPDLIEQMGAVVSDEIRAKYHNGPDDGKYSGVKAGLTVWSPTINMARDPRSGRTQECYGEDPLLTGSIIAGYNRGMVGNDPNYLKTIFGAKHFAANNQEYNRTSFNVEVSEKLLREYFFPPYKDAIDAGGEMIMTAYNAINGEPCVINTWLVDDVLRKEWGFEGIVISDYGSALMLEKGWHHTGLGWTGQEYADSQRDAARLVITRRGANMLNDSLLSRYIEDLVVSGDVLESDIETMAREVLGTRMKLGIFDPPELQPWKDLPASIIASQQHRDFSYQVALQTAVLLKNDGILPLDDASLSKVLVVGPNATKVNIGNYSGTPKDPITGLAGVEARLAGKATVEHVPWVEVVEGIQPIAQEEITLHDGNGIGTWNVAYYNNTTLSGAPVATEQRHPTDLEWATDLPAGVDPNSFSVSFTTTVVPLETGTYELTASADSDTTSAGGGVRLRVDGMTVAEAWLGGNKELVHGQIDLVAGQAYTFEYSYGQFTLSANNTFSAGWLKPSNQGSGGGSEATAAADADVVIAFLGLSVAYESENHDRVVEGLPKQQLDMLRDVLAVNSNVVVVLHNGSSVESPELFEITPAVLEHWYPGGQGGRATASILFGDYNPGGRLPLTFVKSWTDLPHIDDYDLTKGRTYLYMDKEVLLPFGHGLSYTTFDYSGLSVADHQVAVDGTIEVSVTVTNTGPVDGDEVVQLYVRDISNAAANKPRQRLKAFRRVSIASGQSETVQFAVPAEDLAYWNSSSGLWEVQTGLVEIRAGSSSEDIRATDYVAISSATDTDADAMDDAWEIAHGLTVGIDDGMLDKDGDRISNLWEFLTETDPDDPTSAMAVAAEGDPSSMIIRWDAVPNIRFSVLGATNLTEGFRTLEAGIPCPQNSYTDQVDSAVNAVFYKVEAEQIE